MDNEYILEMRNITKEFPGVKALDNVNFKVKKGEIHCLVGENGAGKSTLMKVLSGVWRYGTYTGDIVYEGEVQQFNHIADSEAKGIAIIYQELALFPELPIYENIYFGHEIMLYLRFNLQGTLDVHIRGMGLEVRKLIVRHKAGLVLDLGQRDPHTPEDQALVALRPYLLHF